MTGGQDEALLRFTAALDAAQTASYELTLFVNGASDLSARAVANARELCDRYLAGRYQLSVVDVNGDLGELGSWLFAVPTLVRTEPSPVRRLVGDLSDSDKVLSMLELPVGGDLSEQPQ